MGKGIGEKRKVRKSDKQTRKQYKKEERQENKKGIDQKERTHNWRLGRKTSHSTEPLAVTKGRISTHKSIGGTYKGTTH